MKHQKLDLGNKRYQLKLQHIYEKVIIRNNEGVGMKVAS